MLQIKTTNGNTLIHADQQPDTYNGRSYDGSQYMVHAGEWGRHKYIRKEGNRYIYPEDLQKKASAGLHKVAKVAKDVYEDRNIYAEAAKKMASDAAERSKYRMKDELRKQHEERKAKEAHVKEWNAKMAKEAKKVAKALIPRKVGTVINIANDLANSGKKEEVAERSIPNSEKNVGKRPLSRKKKVVEGEKEIKKGSKTSDGAVGWDGRTADDINHIGADVAKRRDKRTSQTMNAHQGVVANEKRLKNHETTAELERQKRKTKARKSASKRFNELDQKNKRSSNSMEPDIQKQHSQINSAHQMATERRMAGNKHSDREWNRQNLYSVNYYDQSGSIERQKRKTALRKRHKK